MSTDIIKSIVMNKERMAKFSHASSYKVIDDGKMVDGGLTINFEVERIGCNLYYRVDSDEGNQYEFPIDMGDYYDVGTTSFETEIKARTLMRYIRKAIDNDTLIKLNE